MSKTPKIITACQIHIYQLYDHLHSTHSSWCIDTGSHVSSTYGRGSYYTVIADLIKDGTITLTPGTYIGTEGNANGLSGILFSVLDDGSYQAGPRAATTDAPSSIKNLHKWPPPQP